jgi:DNA-binding NarL/FixJ family response regulator
VEPTYQMVIAEEQVQFRAELKKINDGLAGNQGVGKVEYGNELVNLLEKSWPNLILLDISLLDL